MYALEDEDSEAVHEAFGCGVEIEDHCATPPPPNEVDGVWFHLYHE